jgi:hypothetical protein
MFSCTHKLKFKLLNNFNRLFLGQTIPFITKQSNDQEEGNWYLPWLVNDTNFAVAQYPLGTGSIRNHQMDSMLFVLILPKYKSL